MSLPEIILNREHLLFNANTIASWCHERDMLCAAVTKVVCADKEAVRVLNRSEVDFIADSRIKNLKSIETDKPKLLLRIGMPSESEDIVRFCDISMQSELYTLRLLNEAAIARGKLHKVILMIDLGDLREGIFFRNEALILNTARMIHESRGLELYGIGTNLTCYGSVLPDETNMGELFRIANWLRNELDEPIPIVSGGNSSALTMILQNRMPKGVNMFRFGEAIFIGNETANGVPLAPLNNDVYTLKTELVELQTKPSMPIGVLGLNAFGEQVTYEDKGVMRRGIIALGRQDCVIDGLTPVDPDVSVLGASSDHTILDFTACDHCVGDIIEFTLSYGALLSLSTGQYVQKRWI